MTCSAENPILAERRAEHAYQGEQSDRRDGAGCQVHPGGRTSGKAKSRVLVIGNLTATAPEEVRNAARAVAATLRYEHETDESAPEVNVHRERPAIA